MRGKKAFHLSLANLLARLDFHTSHRGKNRTSFPLGIEFSKRPQQDAPCPEKFRSEFHSEIKRTTKQMNHKVFMIKFPEHPRGGPTTHRPETQLVIHFSLIYPKEWRLDTSLGKSPREPPLAASLFCKCILPPRNGYIHRVRSPRFHRKHCQSNRVSSKLK